MYWCALLLGFLINKSAATTIAPMKTITIRLGTLATAPMAAQYAILLNSLIEGFADVGFYYLVGVAALSRMS
jgi:hypothetical protein